MFEAHPLHSFYLGESGAGTSTEKDPGKWDVHLLLLGFGGLGEKALLQAMNLGVAGSSNQILADVVDPAVDEKAGVFLSRFSSGAFRMEARGTAVKDGAADGNLAIRFHRADVRTHAFGELLEEPGNGSPFTYVLIAAGDESVSIRGMEQVQRYLMLRGGAARTPVLLRMDADCALPDYLESNTGTYRNVYKVPGRGAVLSLDGLFAAE